MGYMFYIWIAVMVIAVVFEIITEDLTSFWFAVGAVVALILNLFIHDDLIGLQVAVFAVVSIVSIILLKPVIKKKLDKSKIPTNADALIGKEVYVVENISLNNPGAIKYEGVVWTAVTLDEPFNVNDLVVVSRIEGNKLFVKKCKNNSSDSKIKEGK